MSSIGIDIASDSASGSESWLRSFFKGGEKEFINATPENKTLTYAIYGAAVLVMILIFSKRKRKK